MLLFKVVRSAEFEVSLAVLIAGNKLMCDVSYRDAVCSQLVTIQHYYCRLLNLSSLILDQSHVFTGVPNEKNLKVIGYRSQ